MAEDRAGGFTGDGIEHVDDVQEKEGVGGGLAVGLKVGNMGFDSGMGEVDDGIKAIGDADAKLALGEHVM
jgi:hypothetical protein